MMLGPAGFGDNEPRVDYPVGTKETGHAIDIFEAILVTRRPQHIVIVGVYRGTLQQAGDLDLANA